MFILTLRISETVQIGDDIQVAMLDVKGNKVRVRVNAPKVVSVHQEEIPEQIIKAQKKGGPKPNGNDKHWEFKEPSAISRFPGQDRLNNSVPLVIT